MIGDLRTSIDKAQTLVAEAKVVASKVAEVRKDADLNNDGKIEGQTEWYALLSGLGLLAAGYIETKRKASAAKRDLHTRIDKLSNGAGPA